MFENNLKNCTHKDSICMNAQTLRLLCKFLAIKMLGLITHCQLFFLVSMFLQASVYVRILMFLFVKGNGVEED